MSNDLLSEFKKSVRRLFYDDDIAESESENFSVSGPGAVTADRVRMLKSKDVQEKIDKISRREEVKPQAS